MKKKVVKKMNKWIELIKKISYENPIQVTILVLLICFISAAGYFGAKHIIFQNKVKIVAQEMQRITDQLGKIDSFDGNTDSDITKNFVKGLRSDLEHLDEIQDDLIRMDLKYFNDDLERRYVCNTVKSYKGTIQSLSGMLSLPMSSDNYRESIYLDVNKRTINKAKMVSLYTDELVEAVDISKYNDNISNFNTKRKNLVKQLKEEEKRRAAEEAKKRFDMYIKSLAAKNQKDKISARKLIWLTDNIEVDANGMPIVVGRFYNGSTAKINKINSLTIDVRFYNNGKEVKSATNLNYSNFSYVIEPQKELVQRLNLNSININGLVYDEVSVFYRVYY